MKALLALLIILIVPFLLIDTFAQIDAIDNVNATKFDPYFYDKVRSMIGGEISGADADDDGLYNVIMVVNGQDDNTIQSNKDSLVKLLKEIGAKDIRPAMVLSFVTADIPIQEIPKITTIAQIMQIGDGELDTELLVDKARKTIKAMPSNVRTAHNTTFTGNGVKVSVIDSGINSIYLNDKVIKRSYCKDDCKIKNGIITKTKHNVGTLNDKLSNHGTIVAGVIAASGLPKHNGIAPNVSLLDMITHIRTSASSSLRSVASDLHALDWAVRHGADIVNHSVGKIMGCSARPTTIDIIYDQAVDRGVIVVQAAGNYGRNGYVTIPIPACAKNIITVGGIDDRNQEINMFDGSSRGPTHNRAPILKPEIVAPAVDIHTLRTSTKASMSLSSGTSISAPMVTGTAALMLEADPTLTPTEVKSLLLLGAKWTGPVPCTSKQYEQHNPKDDCSYARQPSRISKDSTSILNNVGFGILNAKKSINYTLNSDTHMISSFFEPGVITIRNYTIDISDTSKPVKIIVNWLATRGNIDFIVKCTSGQAINATSWRQTNEFVVFNPTQAGSCNVLVGSAGLNGKHNYTLSSTVPITYNDPLQILSESNIVSPGKPIAIPLYAYNPDNKEISYTVTQNPTKGTLSDITFSTTNRAIIIYNPNNDFAGNDTFEITPIYDNFKGKPGTITLVQETLPTTTLERSKSLDGITFNSNTIKYNVTSPTNTSSKVITGPSQQLSAIHIIHKNALGSHFKITTNNITYDISLPSLNRTSEFNGSRTFTFNPPIKIDTVQFFLKDVLGQIDPTIIQSSIGGKTQYANFVLYYSDEQIPLDVISPIDEPVKSNITRPELKPIDSELISISIPESSELDLYDKTIDLNTYSSNKIRIDTYYADVGTRYHINDKADIIIFRDTEITNKTFTYNTDQYCYSGDLRIGQTVPNIDMPVNTTNVLYLQFREHSLDRCDQAPDINLDGKLTLDTEVYVRFVGSNGLNPFYTDGSNNVSIPKCSSTNFDDTDNTLIDDTETCYGIDGNDMIIVSKILAVFGVNTQDISTQTSEPVQKSILVPGNIISHVNYIDIVNGTMPQLYALSKINNLFDIMPMCDDIVHDFDHIISMTTNGIILEHIVDNNKASDSLKSIITLNDKSESSVLSTSLIQVDQNSTHTTYASTIPNNLFNGVDSIMSYISDTSNTIHRIGIFSNSSTGSPLYYHNGIPESQPKIFMNLPDADDTVQFVNGNNTGINDPVHVPDGNTVLLSTDVLCRYASINPNNIAEIFDISLSTISNTTDGLEFELTFPDDIPDQINWFATNSTGYTVHGNTIDTITRNYILTIPLSISDTYDITIYGTVQDTKILGLHNRSYEFAVIDPVPVDLKPDPTLSIATHAYQQYADIMNSTTLTTHEKNILYKAVPKCDQRKTISHSITMSSAGDIVINYSTKQDFAAGKLLVITKNDLGAFNFISLDPTLTGTQNNNFDYTNVIPNDILDTPDDHLSVSALFFLNSTVLKNTRIYSTSPDGSPLYYHAINGSNPIVVQLPSTSNTAFTSGTLKGVNGTVYLPQDSNISLNDYLFCDIGFTKPRQIARVYDMDINAANNTDGLEFTYKFGKKTFSSGDKTLREPRPSQFNWIATNSTDSIIGSSVGQFKNIQNFTIPLNQSGNYDIIIYGTNKQGKLLGTHSGSYTFTMPSIQPAVPTEPINPLEPVIPDPPPAVSPIPPEPVNPGNNDANVPVMSIILPESYSHDTTDSTIDLNTYTNNKIRIDTYIPDIGTKYYINNIADITIHRNTEIVNKMFTYNSDQYCYSGDLKVGSNVSGITIPIEDISDVLYLQFREHSPDRCDQAPDIDLDDKLTLDTEVYVRFINSATLNPFYYVSNSIVDIPKCTAANFDSASNKLLNDTMICYGKDNNDIVIISKILAVFGTVPESDPIHPKPVIIPILVPGTIIDHVDYTNLVNTTMPQNYPTSDLDNIFAIMPSCSDSIYELDHEISMTPNGIKITYTVDKSYASNSLQTLVVLDDESTSPRTLSLNLVPTGQNSTHLVYTSTIPNNLFNNVDLSIISYISSTTSTIHKTGIFSNSPTGSPLYYHNGTSESDTLQFMQLPDTDDIVQFVNGTNTGINGTIHVPDDDNVLLSENILCRYASINPNNIAEIFDLVPNTISNTTDGLEFTLTFPDDIPDQINWFATNSTGDTVHGNTIDTMTRNYTLTIPLSISDTYDITIYGTVQDTKILGMYNDSYRYIIPVIPDPPTISITLPESMELDNNGRTIDLYTYADNKIRIDTYHQDTGTKYYINNIADITMFRDTEITSKQFTSTQDDYCYVGDLVVGQDSTISKEHTNTLKISFRNANDITRCDDTPDINLDGKLELDKEVYVRFVGTDGQTPFYHTGGNLVEVAKCTSSNFDDSTSAITSGEICYGKDGSDTIIVSKILAVFGIARVL